MKEEEILSEETAIRRILFSGLKNTPLVRYQRWRYRNNILTINVIEKLLTENGYTKVKTALWTK